MAGWASPVSMARPRAAFNTDWNNIQPRVGAAFQLTPTTVLRGGFGISYIPQVSFGNSFGFSQSTPYVATLDAGQTPASTVSNPFPSGLLPPAGISLGAADAAGAGAELCQHQRPHRLCLQFLVSGSSSVLPGQIRIEASYVGSRTHDAPVTNSFNSLSRPNLALGDVTQGGNPNMLNQQGAESVSEPAARHFAQRRHGPAAAAASAVPAVHGFQPAEYSRRAAIWYNSLAAERAEAIRQRAFLHRVLHSFEEHPGPELSEPARCGARRTRSCLSTARTCS